MRKNSLTGFAREGIFILLRKKILFCEGPVEILHPSYGPLLFEYSIITVNRRAFTSIFFRRDFKPLGAHYNNFNNFFTNMLF